MSSYNYKRYWEKSNYDGGVANPRWAERVKPLLIPGTVLDVGCGLGRHVEMFTGHDYLGIDISSISVATAKRLHPDLRFEVANIVNSYPYIQNGIAALFDIPVHNDKWDNIFTWTVLQHIPFSRISKLAKKLNALGENIVMVEGIGDSERHADHVFWHDYHKYFDIIYAERLNENTWIMRAKGRG